MDKNLLKKGLTDLGITLSNEQITSFQLLFNELKKWGSKINVTALLKDDTKLIEELFIDSLSPLLFLNQLESEQKRLLDIGSGGGFPGIPLQIGRPDLSVTLVDAIEKKIFFIKNVIRKLHLSNSKALCIRFGSSLPSPLEQSSFDFATSKAVTGIDELALWALPFLKREGFLICLKTPHTLISQPSGFHKPEEIDYILPFSKVKRKLIIYKKI